MGGPEVAFALELSGLDWIGEFPGNWPEMKGKLSWRCLPIIEMPDGEQIGHSTGILNYIGRKAPAMAGESDKDFAASQQVLACCADVSVALGKAMTGSMEEYEEAFASTVKDTHNKNFGISVYFQLLEEFYVKCGGKGGQFTETGTTVGECRLFALLHSTKGVKPGILDNFPNLAAFYTTFGSIRSIKVILGTGGRMGGSFKPYFKPRLPTAPKKDEFDLSYWAKSDDTLLPAPASPKYKVALCASYVTSHPSGGSDKLVNGHRFDTIAIANGLINAGIAVNIIFYTVEEHDKFFEVVGGFDGIIIRINPGQITANGGSQQKFDDDMMKLAAKVPCWPTPETMSKMGAKDALCQIKHMDFGLEDTLGYYSPEDIGKGLRKTVAFQQRVVKQNRGSAGEGIWIIKLKSGDYCKTFGEREAADDEVLILKEANDNHIEEHTLAEFIEFCVNGRTAKSGTWTSKGTGKYFAGGVEAGGQMVDQRFLPRIDEGEARFVMIGKELNRVEHYVYIGGVGGETKTTIHKPSDADFPYKDMQKKLQDEVPIYLKSLGLAEDALPLLWAADLIPVDDHKAPMVIGEFNCSCLGLAGFLNVRGGDIKDLKPDDEAMGMAMANLIGEKALEALDAKKK